MNNLPAYIRVLGVVTAITTSFLVYVNWTMYQTPPDLNQFSEQTLEMLEEQYASNAQVTEEEITENLEMMTEQMNQYFTVPKFKQHSLFRLIGNLVVLFGAVVFLRGRVLGYHMMFAASLFLIVSGFILFGMGVIGWTFNLFYIVSPIIALPLFYRASKKHLAQ